MAPHYELMARRKKFNEAAKGIVQPEQDQQKAEMKNTQDSGKTTTSKELKGPGVSATPGPASASTSAPALVVKPAVPTLIKRKAGSWNKIVANGSTAAKNNVRTEKKDTGSTKNGDKKPNGPVDNKPKPTETASASTDSKEKSAKDLGFNGPTASSNTENCGTNKPVSKNHGNSKQAPGVKLLEAHENHEAHAGNDKDSVPGPENTKPSGQKKKKWSKGRSRERAKPVDASASPAPTATTTATTTTEKDSATTAETKSQPPNATSEGQEESKKKSKKKKQSKKFVRLPTESVEIQTDIPYGGGILLPLGRIPTMLPPEKSVQITLPGARRVYHKETQVLCEEERKLALLDTTPFTFPKGKQYVFDIRVVPPCSTVFKTMSYHDRVRHAIRREFSDTTFGTVVSYSVPVPHAGLLMPMVENMNEVKISETKVEVGYMPGYPGEMDFPYNSFNRLQRFYAVAVGGEIGIFESWTEVSELILGVEEPKYRVFPTRRKAQEWLCNELNKERSELAKLEGFYADMEELHYQPPGPKSMLLMKALGISITIPTVFLDEDSEFEDSEETASQISEKKEPEVSIPPEVKRFPTPIVNIPSPKVVEKDLESKSPNASESNTAIKAQPQPRPQEIKESSTVTVPKEPENLNLAKEKKPVPRVHINPPLPKPKKYSQVVTSSTGNVKVEPNKPITKPASNDKVRLEDKSLTAIDNKASAVPVSSSGSTQVSATTDVDKPVKPKDELLKKPVTGKPTGNVPSSLINKIGLKIGTGSDTKQGLQTPTESEPTSDHKSTKANVVETLTRGLGLFSKDQGSSTAKDALMKSLTRNASNDGKGTGDATQPNNTRLRKADETKTSSGTRNKRAGKSQKGSLKDQNNSQGNTLNGSQDNGNDAAKSTPDEPRDDRQTDETRGRRRSRTEDQQKHISSLPVSPSREPFVYRDPPRIAKSAPEFMVRNTGRRNSFWMRRPQPAPDDPTMDSSIITLTESDTGDLSFMKDPSKELDGEDTFDVIRLLPRRLSALPRLSSLLKEIEIGSVNSEATSKATESELGSAEVPMKEIAKVIMAAQKNRVSPACSQISTDPRTDKSEDEFVSNKPGVLNEPESPKKAAELDQSPSDSALEVKDDASAPVKTESKLLVPEAAITTIPSDIKREVYVTSASKPETLFENAEHRIPASSVSDMATTPPMKATPSKQPITTLNVFKQQDKKGSSSKRTVSIAIPNLSAEEFLGKSRQPSSEHAPTKIPATPSSSRGARSPSASETSVADEQPTASTSPATEPREEDTFDIRNTKGKKKPKFSLGDIPKFGDLGESHKRPFMSPIFSPYPSSGRARSVPPRKKFKFEERGMSSKRSSRSSSVNSRASMGNVKNSPLGKPAKFDINKDVQHHVALHKRKGSEDSPEQPAVHLKDRRSFSLGAHGAKKPWDENNIIPALPRVFERTNKNDSKWHGQKPSYAEVMGQRTKKPVEDNKVDQPSNFVQTYERLGQARQTANKQSGFQTDTTIESIADSAGCSSHNNTSDENLDPQQGAKRLTDALDVIEDRLNKLRDKTENDDQELSAQQAAERREAEVEAEHLEIIRQLEKEEEELNRREEWEKAKIREETERLKAEQRYRQRLIDNQVNECKADEELKPLPAKVAEPDVGVDTSEVNEAESKTTKVWAVAKGRHQGLFYKLEEAQESVKGYPNSLFKMFKAKEAAEKWLQEQESDKYLDKLYEDKMADEKTNETTEDTAPGERKAEAEPLKKRPTQLWGVSIGRVTGLFDDHDEVQESVYKYKGAEYKRFNKLKDAEEWLTSKGISTTKESEGPRDDNFNDPWYSGDLENRRVYPTFRSAAYSEHQIGPFFATDLDDDMHSAPDPRYRHWCLVMEVENLCRTSQGELKLDGLDIEGDKVTVTIVDPESLRCTEKLKAGDTIAMLYGRPHFENTKSIPVMRILKENERFLHCFHNCSLRDLKHINGSVPTTKRKDVRGPCDQCEEICHLNYICEPCGVATYCSNECMALGEVKHKPICDNIAYFSRLFDFDWCNYNVINANNYHNNNDSNEEESVGWLGGGGIDFNFFGRGIVRDYSVAMATRIQKSDCGDVGIVANGGATTWKGRTSSGTTTTKKRKGKH